MTRGVPFKKGKSGNPGGRPPGAKNKISYEVADICHKNGCDPFEILAKIATGEISAPKGGVRLRMEAASELASYLAPKLKAVELSSDPTNPVHVVMNFGNANKI